MLDEAYSNGLFIIPTFSLSTYLGRPNSYAVRKELEKAFIDFVMFYCKTPVPDKNKCEEIHPAVLAWSVDQTFSVDIETRITESINHYYTLIAEITTARAQVEVNCAHPLAVPVSVDPQTGQYTLEDYQSELQKFIEAGEALDFEIWIATTLPPTSLSSPDSMVDHLDLFASGNFTEKAVVVRFGYSSIESGANVNTTLQAQLIAESYERVLLRDSGSIYSGCIIDEWSDRWNRFQESSNSGGDSHCSESDFTQTKCGLDSVYNTNGSTSEVVSVEYLGAASQYNYWGTHCLEIRDAPATLGNVWWNPNRTVNVSFWVNNTFLRPATQFYETETLCLEQAAGSGCQLSDPPFSKKQICEGSYLTLPPLLMGLLIFLIAIIAIAEAYFFQKAWRRRRSRKSAGKMAETGQVLVNPLFENRTSNAKPALEDVLEAPEQETGAEGDEAAAKNTKAAEGVPPPADQNEAHDTGESKDEDEGEMAHSGSMVLQDVREHLPIGSAKHPFVLLENE
ncbi:hypothetical protein CYMTET_15338, partial [Cymbomonas tetramitiformis]